MIHFVLHDARDTVAVVVVEGVKAGTLMTGWIMDEDKTIQLQASRTSDRPQGRAQDMASRHRAEVRYDMARWLRRSRRRARPCAEHQDQALVSRRRRKEGPTQWDRPQSARGPQGAYNG